MTTVLVCGLPATGKTTAARRVAKSLGAENLSTDVVRREILEEATLEEVLRSETPLRFNLQKVFDAQEEIPERFQRLIQEQRHLVYDAMLDRARKLVLGGRDVILDGTFYKRSLRERVYGIAREAGAKVYVIECECPEEIVLERLKRRRLKPDAASYVDKMKIYFAVKEKFEDPRGDGMPLIAYNTHSGRVTAYNIEEGDEGAKTLVRILKESRRDRVREGRRPSRGQNFSV